MKELCSGVYAAAAVPFDENLQIHIDELAWHCGDMIERGCTGVVLFGTTGEGPSFSALEKIKALEGLVSKGLNPAKMILANGSSGILDTVQLCKAVIEQGCAAMLISPPSYFKNVQEEGTIAYYRDIIRRVSHPDLRILLYHYPKLSGVPITKGIIAALRQEFPEVVIGLKESDGDLALTRSVLEQFRGFKVFVGKELQIAEAVRLGGAGSICGLANLYPELISSFYKSPNPSHIEKLEKISQAFRKVPFIAAVKAVLQRQRGEIWKAMAPPLVPLSATEREVLHQLANYRSF